MSLMKMVLLAGIHNPKNRHLQSCDQQISEFFSVRSQIPYGQIINVFNYTGVYIHIFGILKL